MKKPESKNLEVNVYISAKELKVGHKFSSESSLRQTGVRNMISYKIIIEHKIKTYKLFQRNTHFSTLKPAQNSHRGTPRNSEDVILNNTPTSHRGLHRVVSYCGCPTMFNWEFMP